MNSKSNDKKSQQSSKPANITQKQNTEQPEIYLTLEQLVQEQTWGLDEANRKLAQARDLFCSLFNANPIPMALMGPEGDVFLNVNAEFLSYFGFQPK